MVMRKVDLLAPRRVATRDYILSTMPILYLPLYDLDGSPFISSDGYGHSCTITGATWGATGRIFDGSDDQISIPDNAVLSSLGPMSISVWYRQDIQADEGIVSKDSGVSGGREWILYTNVATGRLGFNRYGSNSANSIVTIGTKDVSDTLFHHSLVTWTGVNNTGTATIQTDGVDEALSSDSKGGTGALPFDGAYAVEIGRMAASNTYCLDGEVGEVVIWNRLLSVTEARQIYQVTKWRYN